jgi:hypothetical protein
MKLMADAGDGAFEPVLSYLGWWDCPRSGVALVGGQPYYFDCEFSEELDEYPDTFRLWPISGDDLADELEIWEAFAAWRDQFDSGRRPGPFPRGSAHCRHRASTVPPAPATTGCTDGDPRMAP